MEKVRRREFSLLAEVSAGASSPALRRPELEIYDFREGTAEELGLETAVRARLDAEPGLVLHHPDRPEFLYRKDPATGYYRRLTLPDTFYDALLKESQLLVFVVLGAVYVLAVLVLEALIMPRYVYRPLRAMLEADEAVRAGNRNGELIGVEFLTRDEIGRIMKSRNATVSELRRREGELEAALHRLETAKQSIADQDRLASLGLLSASVAHELNTPLAVLHGSIEQLIESVPDAASQERLARMRRVTDRLQRISEGLIGFVRMPREEIEDVELRAVVEEAWSFLAIDDKAKRLEFRNEAPTGQRVRGNSGRLAQLFVNLLRNALLAAPCGGHIWVRTAETVEEGEPRVLVAVEDDGPGIPSEILPDVFEAFVTTRLDARGTGLGLTVAEGIVRQHGGSIAASNRPEGGARLEVRLPAARLSNRR